MERGLQVIEWVLMPTLDILVELLLINRQFLLLLNRLNGAVVSEAEQVLCTISMGE
jgi:hypothetical protein